MKEITKTNWTAGELRALDGCKCKLQYNNRDADGEISIAKNGEVNFLTNSYEFIEGTGGKKEGRKNSWIIYSSGRGDNTMNNDFFESVTIYMPHDEHDNIYYDDNGDEIRTGDEVVVSSGYFHASRIFLCKILAHTKESYICVDELSQDAFQKGESIDTCKRKTCVKKPIEEKKERKLYMTDKEWEEFTSKNNLQL